MCIAKRWWILFIIAAGSSSVLGAEEKLDRESLVDFFADNALGNALALVQHPAGVHEDGVTYVSYQGPETNPCVAAYDHDSASWSGPFQAGVSDLGEVLREKGRVDSHGKPTLLIDDLGYLHVFYGGHGAGADHGENRYGQGGLGRNRHAVSKRPYDISEWEELDNISVFGTYNQALKMDNGDIFLIYRHGAHRSDWVYQKSSDHGRSFEPAVPFLKHKDRKDIKAADSWYVWASKGQGDDIILSYDYHVCWFRGEGPKGLPHVTQRHDLYYMILDTRSGTLRNVQGESLALPVTKEVADESTLVTRTGDRWTFNGSAHLDGRGYPGLAINIGENLGRQTGGPKQTHYFYWSGESWSNGVAVRLQSIQENTDTRGDFFIDSESGAIRFLLGYQEQKDGVIGSFVSRDGGLSFQKESEWLRSPDATWALSARIANAHPDAQLLVAEKVPGTAWRKIYLLGDGGPIQRESTEAAVLTEADRAQIR